MKQELHGDNRCELVTMKRCVILASFYKKLFYNARGQEQFLKQQKTTYHTQCH